MINLNESIINNRFTFRYAERAQLHYTAGIWVNGKYCWLQNTNEKIIYDEQIIVKVRTVQPHSKIQFNHLYVSNHSNKAKKLKVLAMHHHSRISQEQFTFASPKDKVIFHLANKEMFLVNGHSNGIGMKEYTVQPYWNVLTDKIWSSQENGHLKYQPMSKGPAVSIFTIEAEIKPHETIKMNTWNIKGSSIADLIMLDRALLKNALAFPFEK